MVDAVRKQHAKTFEMEVRPAAKHRDELTRYVLGDHGVVCLGSDDKVLWKHAGHDMTKAELDEGVKKVLAALEGG